MTGNLIIYMCISDDSRYFILFSNGFNSDGVIISNYIVTYLMQLQYSYTKQIFLTLPLKEINSTHWALFSLIYKLKR